MRLGKLGNYWSQTETFEALQLYIDMNFEGLRDDILSMIAGETVPVNTRSFTNDMTTFRTEDDVLTLLIHLGYLGYYYADKTVFIPNEEIRSEYVSAVAVSDWGEVSKALKNSADTLQAVWQGREKQVAEGIRRAHFETSHLQYNDENALSYTISLALYAARNFYTVHREFPGGKIEAGETAPECLHREILEEFNMEIRVGKFFMESEYDYSFGTFKLEVYFATCTSWVIPDLFEHEQARWVDVQSLKDFNFSPADIPVAEALLKLNDLSTMLL